MLSLGGVSPLFKIAFCIILFGVRDFLRSELGSVDLELQFGMYKVGMQYVGAYAIAI